LGVTAALVGLFVLPASVSYTVTERYAFSSADSPSAVWLAVLLPKSGPYQSVGNLQVSWPGKRSLEAQPGLDVLKLEGQVAAGGSTEALISYEVKLPQGSASWEGQAEAFQTQPQPGIESQDPALVAQAEQVGGDNAQDRAYGIFSYSSDKLSWPTGTRTGPASSALEAYRSGVGGCDEFARLTTALLRAEQIPSQVVGGLAFGQILPFTSASSTWGHPAGAHAWVELKAGERWEMADPSFASYFPKWLYYGRNDGHHLSYGEEQAQAEAFDAARAWAEGHGVPVGSMSAPLKFAAAGGEAGVVVTPGASVKAGWNGTYANLVLMVTVVALGVRFYEKRKK
jgi:hypothetical protein